VTEPDLEKDLPLREDIRLLGRLLGDTLQEQEGSERFELIETIRQTAVRFHRDDDAQAKRELENILNGIDHDTAISVVRAFSFFSQLANIAEDQHYSRRRRVHEIAGSPPRKGRVALALLRLREAGVTHTRLIDFFNRALIAPVLTAHPTEVQRKSILDCQLEVARLLAERNRPALTPDEQRANEEALRRVVLSLWQTRILRTTRLTVQDEIENGLSYFRYTFLRELPLLYADLEDRIAAFLDDDGFRLSSPLRIGNWIGGDRDGNPFVTQEVMRHALHRQSTLALDFYLGEVHQLGAELSMARRLVGMSAELDRMAEASPDRSAHRRDEPYRRALIGVYSRLAATAKQLDQPAAKRRAAGTALPYAACAEFIAELDVLADSLSANGGARIARGRLRQLRRAAEVFGFHLCTLDMRQHSGVHESVVAELFARSEGGIDYPALTEDAKLNCCCAKSPRRGRSNRPISNTAKTQPRNSGSSTPPQPYIGATARRRCRTTSFPRPMV
jgi:phosphoenolpyruvate carboxylase